MIRFIKGKFYPQADGSVVVETSSGIGFNMMIPANCPLYKHYEGEEVKAYTYMAVREDDISLYGFSSTDELELYTKLISVSGVGAKVGIAIMSVLPVDQLKHAIASGDAKTIASANGVGKKTAQRVVLELKDKVKALGGLDGARPAAAQIKKDSAKSQAADALIALGFTRTEALTALAGLPDEGLTTEEYIRKALTSRA